MSGRPQNLMRLFEFSLDVCTEFAELSNKILHLKMIIQTSNLLCKRWRCYHSASKGQVTDRIFKLTPIYALVIYQCCDLTFQADSRQIPNLRTFVHNWNSNACKCNNHVQRLQMLTLIVMIPLQFELSQSSSSSSYVRQTCQLASTLVTTEIMIWQKC